MYKNCWKFNKTHKKCWNMMRHVIKSDKWGGGDLPKRDNWARQGGEGSVKGQNWVIWYLNAPLPSSSRKIWEGTYIETNNVCVGTERGTIYYPQSYIFTQDWNYCTFYTSSEEWMMLAILYRLDQTHTYTYKGTHTHFHIHNYLHAQTHRLEKVKLNIVLGGESTECGITKLGVRNASQLLMQGIY